MNCLPVVRLLMGLFVFTACAGCASAPQQPGGEIPGKNLSGISERAVPAVTGTLHPAIPSTRSITAQLAAVKSNNAIWREAYRMFSAMKSTEYVHPPYTVDDATGIYRFDCLGFVDHVLINADALG